MRKAVALTRTKTSSLAQMVLLPNCEVHIVVEIENRKLLAWIAEDDAEMRRMIAKVLHRAGFRVDEFSNGKQLVERIEMLDESDTDIETPAILIIDHLMPEVHGLDAAAALKDRKIKIPFIVITAFGDVELHKRAELLGAVAVLDKPFDLGGFRDLALRAVNSLSPSAISKP